MIAIGLLATVAAALLSTDKPIGAATLEWVGEAPMPDSKTAAIPGGGTMQLGEGGIRSTEPNISDYTLFRVSARAANRRGLGGRAGALELLGPRAARR